MTLEPASFTFNSISAYRQFQGWWTEHMLDSSYDLTVPRADELVADCKFGSTEERMFCLLRWR
jgi:hypothetical protein